MGHPVHQQQSDLESAFSVNALEELTDGPGVSRCVKPLLSALGWRGEARHLIECLPHFQRLTTIDDLRTLLVRLNYDCDLCNITPSGLTAAQLPSLIAIDATTVHVVVGFENERLHIFDATSNQYRQADPAELSGKIYVIREADLEARHREVVKLGWMAVLVRRFRLLFAQLLGVTFFSNLFALAVPVYVMNVYDKVIGTRATDTLFYFLAGIGIIIGADLALRAIRSRALAYLGARFDTLLGAAAFQQLLHLPVHMTERAPIGAQMSRLKQFDGIREIFTGTIASAALDMPFVLVFIVAIIMIGGLIAVVPVALIVIFAVLAAFTMPATRHHVAATGEVRSRMQSFLIEMVTKQRAIKDAHAEAMWLERFRRLSADASRRHHRSQQLNTVIQTVAQALVMAAGIGTIAMGTMMVMDDAMSIGALIAVMAFVWRVLSPIQAVFLNLNRVSQAVMSLRQLNHLMRLKPERLPGLVPSFYREFTGAISLSRVSFRYTPRSEPALMSVTLDIPAGQIVAVTGASGAGKSTLLRIIAGLYPPQAGAVLVDGLDIRQLDMGELRQAISYVPQKITLFYGTIEQNLRLAHPEATGDEVKAAARAATLDHFCDCLPDQLQTRMSAEFQRQIPDGFKQRVVLARAYIKNAPIFLLDEPANNLDSAGDAALASKLEQLRGRSTVIMVTHRPSHMSIADRVIFMDHGQVVHDGKPEQVLPLILSS